MRLVEDVKGVQDAQGAVPASGPVGDARLAHGAGRWIGEADHLRGIAVVAVVIIHCTGFFRDEEMPDWLFEGTLAVNALARFAVPLFIFVSGLVLSTRYWGRYDREAFYVRRGLNVVPQYLVWSVLYIGLYTALGDAPGHVGPLLGIATGSAARHMWFFVIIMQLYVMYPIIAAVYADFERRGRELQLLALALAAQVAWYVGGYLVIGLTHSGPIAFIVDRSFITHVFYFVLGIHFARNLGALRERLRGAWRWTLALGPLAVVLVIAHHWTTSLELGSSLLSFVQVGLGRGVGTLYHALAIVLCFAASGPLARATSRVTMELGSYSYGIYLIHILVLEVMVLVLEGLGLHFGDWALYPALFLGTLPLSYLAVRGISRAPSAWVVLGRGAWAIRGDEDVAPP